MLDFHESRWGRKGAALTLDPTPDFYEMDDEKRAGERSLSFS